MSHSIEINKHDTPEAVFHAAAQDFMSRALSVVKKKGHFNVVLSGGNTPKKFFTVLANETPYHNKTPWDKIHFYFGDERYVPETDENNNYHMACEYLFAHVPVPNKHVHRIPTTEFDTPEAAAADYAKTIQSVEFDLQYLGLGDNSHTASLMPHTPLVKAYANHEINEADDPLVSALWVEELQMHRITLTPPAINNSDCIHFLVVGKDKAQAVWNILKGPKNPEEYPAQLIHSTHGKTIWFLDHDAASKINE